MPRALVMLLTGLLVGCRAGVPKDGDGPPPRTDTDRPPETDQGDSDAPDLPCDLPESEPNNTEAEAEALPTEVQACGDFLSENDADFWAVEMPEDGWLAVDLDGYSVGSEARLSLTLSSPGAAGAFAVSQSNGLPEVHLRFPASASSWVALVRQAAGPGVPRGAGEDHFYELMVSSAKAPLSWDLSESANDAADAAHILLAGEIGGGTVRVFGVRESAADQDWYEVDLPAAGWAVAFDVDAHAHGSAGNFALRRIDEDGVVVQTVTRDTDGVGWDPWLDHVSAGAERVRVAVLEEEGAHGGPFWYRLTVTVEAP